MNDNIKPTESELDILSIIWDKGSCTVRDVHTELEKAKETKYTTTLKLMQIMHEKGLLTRDNSAKVHVFSTAIPKEKTQGLLLRKMIDTVFNGSASNLIMQALGNHKATDTEIDAIKKYLSEIEEKNKG